MPKLQEYVAPSRELRPENTGYQGFETAGRRVGGMYRESASDIATTAKVSAQTLADKQQWPFTLFALKQKFDAAAKGKGGGFRVVPSKPSVTDAQFGERIMPNLYAEDLAASAAENAYQNPMAKYLSPEGAHQQSLADQAAQLTKQLQGLIGTPAGSVSGGGSINGVGVPMPTLGPSPNADAEASANGQNIYGVPVPTGGSTTSGISTESGQEGGDMSTAIGNTGVTLPGLSDTTAISP